MEFILMFIIIYVLSIAISQILNKKIDLIIPITIVSIVLVIYIFGIFNKLTIGMIALKFITIISVLFIIYKIIKNKKDKTIKDFFKNILTPGILIYILFIITNILLNKNRLLEFYDNFNHWALIVKNMYLYNGYGTIENSIISFNEYPPFTATFQYILLNLKGQYSEDVIIMAHNMLYFSMIMPLFNQVNWKCGKTKLIYILPTVILMPLIFYSNFYTDILVDGFMGILFALGIYEILKDDSNKKYKYTIIGAYTLAISLTKNIGIIFGILLILLELRYILTEKIKNKQDIKKDIVGIFIIILAVIIFVGGWYLIINLNDSNLMWDTNNKEWINNEYKENVIQIFIHEIYTGTQKITVQNLSALVIFVMYVTYSIFLYKKCKNNIKSKHMLKSSILLIIVTIVGYIFGMLYAYIYLFREDETMILSSFNRYISCVLLAGFFLNTIILEEIIEWKNYYISFIIMIILIFVPFEEINNRYVEFNKYNVSVMAKRNEYGKISKYRSVLSEDDIIYFVSNKFDNLYAVALSKYEMMPITIISEENIEDKDFEKIIKEEITYIYVLNESISINNKIKNILNLNFEFEEDSLYKVNKTEEGIDLERVVLK